MIRRLYIGGEYHRMARFSFRSASLVPQISLFLSLRGYLTADNDPWLFYLTFFLSGRTYGRIGGRHDNRELTVTQPVASSSDVFSSPQKI